MSEEFYRNFFAQCKQFMKLSQFCKQCGVSQSHLSNFIKYGVPEVSLDKLDQLYRIIVEFCENVA